MLVGNRTKGMILFLKRAKYGKVRSYVEEELLLLLLSVFMNKIDSTQSRLHSSEGAASRWRLVIALPVPPSACPSLHSWFISCHSHIVKKHPCPRAGNWCENQYGHLSASNIVASGAVASIVYKLITTSNKPLLIIEVRRMEENKDVS